MTIYSSSATATEQRKDVERRLSRLKILDAIRSGSLPAVAAVAVAAGFSAPLAFPIAAVVGAGLVAIAQGVFRHERQILDREIRELEQRHGVADQVLKDFSSETNRLTVGGSSN